MTTEEFCLRWNNHHNVLVTVLDKLLEKESMVDVTLASEGQFLRVHRLVLCACSQYFEEMLSHQSDKQAIIFLKDVKFADLKALVDYMYKGEVNVAQEQLSSFLNTAEALNVKGLAYKEDSNDQPPSKHKSNFQNSISKPSSKKTSDVSTTVPVVSGISTLNNSIPVVQIPEAPQITQPLSNKPVRTKGSSSKKSQVSVHSESHSNHQIDSDDHFVAVDLKLESEMETDQIEDHLEGDCPEWNPRDGEDDWSTSDPGLMVIPNSDSSSVPISTCFVPPTESWSGTDNVAGPSGNGPSGNGSSGSKTKSNNTSNSTNSRGWKGGQKLGERVPCPNCQRTYKNKKHLYRHLRSGCGEEAERSNNCQLPVFRCIVCPYRTYIRGFLNRHTQSMHGRSINEKE